MATAGEFLSPKTKLIRVWHWLNAIALFGLMATAILRKTFLSWRTNSAIIVDKMAEAGTTVTPELAKDIAVTIRTPMWDFHYIFGFALVSLFIARIAMSFMPGQPGIWSELKATFGVSSRHKTLVKIGYFVFYIIVAYMAVSGVLMYFKAELGLDKAITGQLKEIHEWLMWYFYAFTVQHIVGVFLAEVQGNEGLVSAMISGGDQSKE